VEPYDIKGLTKSIEYLMKNKTDRENIESNAIKKASSYDWEVVTKNYKALYERDGR
jgi:glycosyltransferase involved in cell wall biosynthesis